MRVTAMTREIASVRTSYGMSEVTEKSYFLSDLPVLNGYLYAGKMPTFSPLSEESRTYNLKE